MKPTIFFGASSYVLPLLDFLKNSYNLQLVITTESDPADAVPAFCKKNNIPFLSVKKLDEETVAKIKETNVSFAVLADFRLMVRQDVIDLFPKGIINVHPSLLPEYRGPTPGTTAILDGKDKTGVSLMILDKDLDHGALIGQAVEPVLPNDTSVTLYQRLFEKGVSLLQQNLSDYLEGKIKPVQQNHSQATYTEFLTRQSGFFEATNPPTPQQFDRMIRAYYPWPGVWTKVQLGGKERIVKFLPNPRHPELDSGSLKNNFLLQTEGKKPVSYKDFLNGYPDAKEHLEKLGII